METFFSDPDDFPHLREIRIAALWLQVHAADLCRVVSDPRLEGIYLLQSAQSPRPVAIAMLKALMSRIDRHPRTLSKVDLFGGVDYESVPDQDKAEAADLVIALIGKGRDGLLELNLDQSNIFDVEGNERRSQLVDALKRNRSLEFASFMISDTKSIPNPFEAIMRTRRDRAFLVHEVAKSFVGPARVILFAQPLPGADDIGSRLLSIPTETRNLILEHLADAIAEHISDRVARTYWRVPPDQRTYLDGRLSPRQKRNVLAYAGNLETLRRERLPNWTERFVDEMDCRRWEAQS